jgi:hypothetical protein
LAHDGTQLDRLVKRKIRRPTGVEDDVVGPLRGGGKWEIERSVSNWRELAKVTKE